MTPSRRSFSILFYIAGRESAIKKLHGDTKKKNKIRALRTRVLRAMNLWLSSRVIKYNETELYIIL